ncbi:MAG: hypothetical protein PUB69_05715 [Desulfovibrionaceae bacterium]|nr:hypothetical protein [Desulfovibrionaceae bacterium]
MKKLILYDGIDLQDVVSTGEDVSVSWDRGAVPEGCLSIPQELEKNLLAIRQDLAAWTFEMGLIRIGGTRLEKLLRAGDSLSMWWCSTLFEKHPKVTRRLFAALKLRALERLLDEGGFESLELRRTADGDARLSRILMRFCEETGREFAVTQISGSKQEKNIRQNLADSLAAVYYSLPGICKVLVRFPVWMWQVRRRLSGNLERKAGLGEKRSTIVTYFPNIDMEAAKEGRFHSRYWESLHEALRSENGDTPAVNWIFLYYPAPQCSFTEAVALRDVFRKQRKDGASFHFLEEFLTPSAIRRAMFRYFRLWLTSLRITSAVREHFFFPKSKMDLWPLLGCNWNDSFSGWRALERCLMREAFRNYAEWAGPQQWTLFPQENCPWERMLAQSVHEAGNGPVYGAQHSTVRPTDFRYFDDPRIFEEESCKNAMLDSWLCNGTGSYRQLAESGMPERLLKTVEALRYQYLARMGRVSGTGPRTLLVVTSFFEDETEAHLKTLADSVRSGFLDGWKIIVKPHPYLPVAQRLQELLGAKAPCIGDGPIGSFFCPGTVVWASNSTTVALEAAYSGLAVLVQAAENDVDLCPLQNMPGVVMVRTAADVSRALVNPRAPELPEGYLSLDPDLPRWKKMLGLKK